MNCIKNLRIFLKRKAELQQRQRNILKNDEFMKGLNESSQRYYLNSKKIS